jgi:VanZ family protein
MTLMRLIKLEMQESAIAWKVAAVAWALVIFSLSTGGFGPSYTERVLAGALGLFHLTISKAGFEVFHFCVRKSAHLAEYAVFAALLCASSEEDVAAGAFIPTGSGPCPISNDHKGQWRHEAAATPNPWRPRRVLGCFLIAFVYSLTDEYHQSFVPGRNASLADCGIDAIGAAMGILAYYVHHLRLRAVGLCGSGILSVSNHGQNGHATIHSGGERPPLQKGQSGPITSLEVK